MLTANHLRSRRRISMKEVGVMHALDRPIWRLLLGGTIIVELLLLSACTQLVPKRSFSAIELLLESTDVPEWKIVSGPRVVEDHIGSTASEATMIAFETADHERGVATNYVYRYNSMGEAKRVYRKFFSKPVGETPSEWEYRSEVADQFSLACHDYGDREPIHCEWAGRYEEYVVTFGVWLIPGRVSLKDAEQVVRIMDARIAQYIKRK